MYCSQCATPLEPSMVYCPTCAKPVASFSFGGQPAQVEEVTVVSSRSPEKKSNSRFGIALTAIGGALFIFAVIVIAVAGTAAFFMSQQPATDVAKNSTSVTDAKHSTRGTQTNAQKDESASTPLPTPPAEKKLIVNQQFPVGAQQMVYHSFGSGSPMRITGGFVAYGGANDIDAIIVDEDNFRFVQNNLGAKTYFHSGYTSKGRINVTVPAGRYYLIFDNRKAWLTGKSVAAEAYYQEQ